MEEKSWVSGIGLQMLEITARGPFVRCFGLVWCMVFNRELLAVH